MEPDSKVVYLSEWNRHSSPGPSAPKRPSRIPAVTVTGYVFVLAGAVFAAYVLYQSLSLGVFANPVVLVSLGSAALYGLGGGFLIRYGGHLARRRLGPVRPSELVTLSEERETAGAGSDLAVSNPDTENQETRAA